MKFKIFTLFPESIESYLKSSILGRGLEKQLWSYDIINIRDYSLNRHKKVDDIPFGGGCGMVMQPDCIANAIDQNCNLEKTKFYYPSPRGSLFNQKKVNEIIKNEEIAIICGRYEGIDQRVIEEYNMEEISVGDYVLTGGELGALIIMDATIRNLDGVLGNNLSLETESFGGLKNSKYDYLLEHPLYTQPRIWKNKEVPEVLLSGNHKKIEEWKLKESEKITEERRIDLWDKYMKNNV